MVVRGGERGWWVLVMLVVLVLMVVLGGVGRVGVESVVVGGAVGASHVGGIGNVMTWYK